jgi:hypothetical protein
MRARADEPTRPHVFAGDVAFLKVGQRGNRASWQSYARESAREARLGRGRAAGVPRRNQHAHAQRAARRKERALQRLRASIGLDRWQLDVAARDVVEAHWARYAGLEIFRAATAAFKRQRKPTKRKPAERFGKRENLAGE